jgi:hypothetical protein
MEMIGTDKIRHYLAYAIGEILLIVIGILIAVQLSNLNDQRRAWNAPTWNASRLIYAPTLCELSDDRETEQAGYKRYQQVPGDGLISLSCVYWNVIRFVFFG